MQTCKQALAVGQFLQAKEQTEFSSINRHRKMLAAYRDRHTDK